MSLTKNEMDNIIDQHFLYEANDDVEGVLSTLDENVIHDIVGSPTGPTHGPENARPFYEKLFSDLAEGNVTCEKIMYGDNFLVDYSVLEGKGVGIPIGFVGKG